MYPSSREREGRKKRRMRRKGRERREGKERIGERSEEVKQESERRSTKVNRVEGSESISENGGYFSERRCKQRRRKICRTVLNLVPDEIFPCFILVVSVLIGWKIT